MSVPKVAHGLREHRPLPKIDPWAALAPGDKAVYHNWSGNQWTLVEIVEVQGARYRVKHAGVDQIFSAHRSMLRKVPAREEEKPDAVS